MITQFINLHLLMLLFTYYNYIIAVRNININSYLKILFNTNEVFYKYLYGCFKFVFIEELWSRVYLNELLYYITDTENIHLYSSICFSLGHFINYFKLKRINTHNIRMTINQVIYTFFLSYYYLQALSPLNSLLCHLYANMFCIFTNYLLYKNKDYNNLE